MPASAVAQQGYDEDDDRWEHGADPGVGGDTFVDADVPIGDPLRGEQGRADGVSPTQSSMPGSRLHSSDLAVRSHGLMV
ncbi:hypothetical protein [uncultured Jannaschia sp.]|uniref:hypothetical protein n=1 Tax=uncultured Jannaschia sp. TaxID=293347 RepID=UPI002612578A|nr:hypothetical protein [uncultured Jannaschia sp.]